MLALKKRKPGQNVFSLNALSKTAPQARVRMNRAIECSNNIRSIMSKKLAQRPRDTYKVRALDSSEWTFCFAPPEEDKCAEWLYFDLKGFPAIYWSAASGYILI